MCLYTKHRKPQVAQRDIKVYKNVNRYVLDQKIAVSPCQGTQFSLDTPFIPDRSTPDIENNGSLYEINGGVIHACLWPSPERGSRYLEAYIPKGTEYWIGVDHTTVCARKLVVLSKPIEATSDKATLDPIMAEMLYHVATSYNGVKIGDFIVTDENNEEVYCAPTEVPNVPKNKIKGMVVGFNGRKPLIADIFHILEDVVIDARYNSKLDTFISEGDKAEKDMDGLNHTKAWKSQCAQDKNRFEAYNKLVAERGEDYYIPALGEMKQLLDNVIYIAAACSLAGMYCPIYMNRSFWTSTEYSQGCCWYCGIGAGGWGRDWCYKNCHNSLVPFYASAPVKKK